MRINQEDWEIFLGHADAALKEFHVPTWNTMKSWLSSRAQTGASSKRRSPRLAHELAALRLRSVAPTFWLEDEKEGHVFSEQSENSECGPPPWGSWGRAESIRGDVQDAGLHAGLVDDALNGVARAGLQ